MKKEGVRRTGTRRNWKGCGEQEQGEMKDEREAKEEERRENVKMCKKGWREKSRGKGRPRKKEGKSTAGVN